MRFIKFQTAAAFLLMTLLLSGCSRLFPFLPHPKPPAPKPSPAPSVTTDSPAPKPDTSENTGKLQLKIAEPDYAGLKLDSYDGGFFTMDIPSGWVVDATGVYENFGFRLYDPEKPQRQIFFYGNMSPFLKSFDAKEAWKTYVSTGGFADAQLYADAPVLSPATTEQFFYTFNAFAELANNYGISHKFPAFGDLEIVESTPRSSPIAGVATDDSIVRGMYTDSGIPCEGLFAAGVVDAMTSYMYNVDAGYYTVYVITGIAAPADEFAGLQDIMAQSLSTFAFSQDYIAAGVAQNQMETESALQVARTLAEAYDSYNQAWHDRQKVYDAIYQKYSDATLGYETVYDPETGDVFKAEAGFYDQYDDNRDDYTNNGLQLVPDDAYDLYSQPVSGYIYNGSMQ